MVQVKYKMACECKNCLKALVPSADPWVRKVRSMITSGKLVHVDTTRDGRAVYREI
jgi:hypothetical protein